MLKKLTDGLNLVLEAWDCVYRNTPEGGSVFSKEGWTATVRPRGKEFVRDPMIFLEGHRTIFIFEASSLPERLIPPINLVALKRVFKNYRSGVDLKDIDIEEDMESDLEGTFWNTEIGTMRNQLWLISCYLSVPTDEKLTENEKLLVLNGMENFNNASHNDKFLEIFRRVTKPGIDDVQAQLRIVKEYAPGIAEFLKMAALVDTKIFMGLDFPVVYFGGLPLDNVLTQMCIWACRQIGSDGALEEYIQEYVRKILHGGPKKYAKQVVSNLILHWKAPPGKGSLDSYIRGTAKNYKKTEDKEKAVQMRNNKQAESADIPIATDICGNPIYSIPQGGRRSKTSGKIISKAPVVKKPTYPVAVKEAVEILNSRKGKGEIECSSRWLYDVLEKGKIKNAGGVYTKVLPGGLRSTAATYLLDEESMAQVKKLLEERMKRKELIQYLVGEKGITKRGARKRIKENRDKGKTWEEITLNIIASP